MNNYILGIDLGITSVGFGVINKQGDIITAGVRLFEEGNPANNMTRREKRSSRRVKRRRKQRIIDLKNLLQRRGFIDNDFSPLPNPYQIRKKGLSQKLTPIEFATAVLHIAKRRGSSLDITDFDESKEDAISKQAILHNKKQIEENNLHVCELQLNRLKEFGKIRGHQNIFKVEDYVRELIAIFKNQDISESLQHEIIEIIQRKRHYSEGPGSKDSPTPYGRYRIIDGKMTYVNLIEAMRGKCTIFETELRAPMQSFSAELHNFLNDLNNIRIIDPKARHIDFLGKITKEGKQTVINIIKKQGYLIPKTNQVKGLANILETDVELIEGLREKNGKPNLTVFNGYQKILKVFNKYNYKPININTIVNQISEILTSYKLTNERAEMLKLIIKDQNDVFVKDIASLNGFEKFHSFSFKALDLLNDELMNTSLNQMQIITNLKLFENKEKPSKLVLEQNIILSPVARRAQREALKVIEALQDEYGYFDKIIVETTRAKNSRDEKQRIKKAQNKREKENSNINALIEKHAEITGRQKGQTFLKLKLYKEQNGKCAYTNLPLDIDAIIHQRDDYEIDHIIPYSISFDNSLHNKVLSTRKSNQLKGTRTPFEYFMSGKAYGAITDYQQYKSIVLNNSNYSKRKKELLTREDDVSKHIKDDFIARNLVDTSYAIRTFMATLKSYYKAHNINTKVHTIKGQVTSMFRGIGKAQIYKDFKNLDTNPLEKNRDEYKHHAIDALIVARLTEQSVFKEAFKIYRSESVNEDTGEILHLKQPDEDGKLIKFLKKLGQLKDEDIYYSWKIDTKPNRSFSDETIYSTRTIKDEKYVVKKYKDIYDMSSIDIEKKLFLEKSKENILMYKNDRQTFELLKKAYNQYKHEKYPFAVYKESHGPLRKYSKKNNGPVIKNIKYIDKKLGSHIDVSHKYNTNQKNVVLLQISPYRTDFYQNLDGTYKFVTIKYANLKPEKTEYFIDENWYNEQKKIKEIDEDAKFLFSMHRNEIIELKQKDQKSIKYRFIGTNNDKRNKIEVNPITYHEQKQLMPTIGKKTTSIKKYATNSIGRMYEIKNELLKLRV